MKLLHFLQICRNICYNCSVSDPINVLQKLLKTQGYSVTAPRKVVFDALQGQEPQTMRELFLQIQNKIDRASLYRTVTLFEELGVVQRLQIGWKYKLELTDKFSHHHHHLSCIKCGQTIAIDEDTALEKRMRQLAEAQGFKAQDHQLEIRGLCKACQNTGS